MLGILNNNTLFQRFMQYAGLAPLVLHLIQAVETAGGSGDDKRAKVIAGTVAAINALVQRGYAPAEILEGVHTTVGDMADTLVAAYNQAGVFAKRGDDIDDLSGAYTGGGPGGGNPAPPAPRA